MYLFSNSKETAIYPKPIVIQTDCYSNRLLHDDLALHSMREQSSDSLLRSWINLRMLQLKNVVMTPHVAFNSIDAVHRILKTANDNIEAYLQGNPRNPVMK